METKIRTIKWYWSFKTKEWLLSGVIIEIDVMEEVEFELIAKDDEFGRKLQDLNIRTRKRAKRG